MSQPLRPTATIAQTLTLDLRCRGEDEETTQKIAKSLSGAACRGGYLFVGSDEGPGFERLHNTGAGSYGERETFPLGNFFDLPGHDDDEADVESLSIRKDWLWLVTSHARTRSKLKDGVKKFAKMRFHERRYVLGRIPLIAGEDDAPTPVRRDGNRDAWCVPMSERGSVLMDTLAEDPHLRHFLDIPAKENGLDIEGLAVGKGRVVLGLRGPVLRGRAVLLDLNWSSDEGFMAENDGDTVSYEKMFVDFDGLGVRDLCRRGEDLMILAGPTIPMPAPYRVHTIPGFFAFSNQLPVSWCDVPIIDGQHPEGLAPCGDDPNEFIMVVDGEKSAQGAQAQAYLIRLPG